MGYYADTVDVDFSIPAEKVPAALAAVNADLGGGVYSTLADAVEDLTSFEWCEEGPQGFTLGSHGDKYLSSTDELLTTLAAFAVDGAYVRFNGEDHSLFGFRVLDGQLREESGDYTWSLAPLRPGTESQGAD